MLSDVDDEGMASRSVKAARKWLDEADSSWEQGLECGTSGSISRKQAKLIAMRQPPTRQVELWRQGQARRAGLA